MSSEARSIDESGGADDQARAWRPSRKPDHQFGRAAKEVRAQVFERPSRKGPLATLLAQLQRPLVKAVVAVCLFVVVAMIFDATINGGSWTERASKQKGVQRAAPPTTIQ